MSLQTSTRNPALLPVALAFLLMTSACGGSQVSRQDEAATGGPGSPVVAQALPMTLVSSAPTTAALVDAGSVSAVTATFDKDLNASTATTSSVSLLGPSGAVAATVSASGKTVTLSPSSALAGGAAYTLTVTTGLKAVDGSALATNASLSFTTRASISAIADECSTRFYSGGLTLVSGMDNSAPVASSTPAKGAAFVEQNYRTCMVRVTNRATEGGSPAFLRNDYSRRQSFNADSSRMLAYSYDGSWHLYNGNTLSHVTKLSSIAGDAEPQWDTSDPNTLYYLPTNGGMTVHSMNVQTGATTTVGNFSGRLPWSGAAHVWTKSEGSPSADRRYWCFMVDSASWSSLGVFVWDKQTNTILGTLNTNGNRPDHVSMSPSGRHCVVSWLNETVSFSPQMVRERVVHTTSEHSDMALGPNGEDYFVAVDYQSNAGSVFMTNLDTGTRTNLFDTYISGTATALHISGRSFSKPGWVVVSTYAGYGGARQWLHDKIFAVQLAANPQIKMLAHTQRVDSNGWSVQDGNYWSEPQASVNRDFTKVIFNSNWNAPASPIEIYMIQLPQNAVQ